MLTKGQLLRTSALSVLALLLTIPAATKAANVLPTNPVNSAGSATPSTSGNAMTVTQTTNKAVINWNSFSVGDVNSVTFKQPDAASATLNRVTGNTTSTIAGSINANGQVFLINPNGIAITPTGTVNAGGGFVASTLNITDADFNSGNLKFNGTGASKPVDNQGAITTNEGGFVALVGGAASNGGTITAPLGKVAMGAGEQATLNLTGDGFLQIAVPSTGGDVTQPLINANGTTSANGGRIELKAATAKAVVRQAINIPGRLEANTVSGQNGAIVLDGGEGGSVSLSGSIAATDSLTVSGHDIAILTPINTPTANLTLSAETTVEDSGLINVNKFALNKGNWTQNTASLPDFTAKDFTFDPANATFLRAVGGDGSADTPYLISDIFGLQGIASHSLLDKNYAVANNIDAAGTASWNTGTGFTPIGTSDNPFTGNFNGRDHAISDLFIARVTDSGVGLFGTADLNGNSISHIGLNGGIVGGLEDTGALVGNLQSGSISYAYADTHVIGVSNTGGLVGFNSGSIEHSTAVGDVQGIQFAGGLIGDNEGNIGTARGAGNVSGSFSVGGLTGYNGVDATIDKSYATGKVSSADVPPAPFGNDHQGFGGLAGGNDGVISNSWSSGAVTTALPDTLFTYVGGLVGGNNGTLTHVTSFSTVDAGDNSAYVGGIVGFNTGDINGNSRATGSVTGQTGVGGLVGYNQGHLLNVYSTGAVTGDNYVGGLAGGNEAQIENASSYSKTTGTENVGGLAGLNSSTGEIKNSYTRNNVSGINNVGGLVGDNEGEIEGSAAGGSVTNISNPASDFTAPQATNLGGLVGINAGTIDNSHSVGTVTAVATTGYNEAFGGLVGTNDGNISDSYASGAVSGQNTRSLGGFAGQNNGSIDGKNYATGNVSSYSINSNGWDNLGGLVGYNTGSITGGAYASGNVGSPGSYFSRFIGGLVGTNYYGTISDSASYGTVTGPQNVGGLVGANYGNSETGFGTIDNSQAKGTVTGLHIVGGLVGVSNDDAHGNLVLINHSKAYGDVLALGDNEFDQKLDYAGGFVGTNYGTIANSETSGAISALGLSGRQLNIGGFVGYNENGRISNSTAKGNIISPYIRNVGGFAGFNNTVGSDVSASIENSIAFGNVDGGGYVGGFVGLNNSDITNSYSHGSVAISTKADVGQTGGFVGVNRGDISNAGSTSNVSPDNSVIPPAPLYIGGFAGQNFETIENSFSTGSVTGNSYLGGFVGMNGGIMSGNVSYGNGVGEDLVYQISENPIKYVVNPSRYAGGFAGYNYNLIENSKALGNISGTETVGGFVGVNGISPTPASFPVATITNGYAHNTVTGTTSVGDFAGTNYGVIN